MGPMLQHRYEVFFSGAEGAGVESVLAPSRKEALEWAAQGHPGCDLGAFHSTLINAARRDGLLAEWLSTL